MNNLTIIVIKNNVPKVVGVTAKVRKAIEKAYYKEKIKFNPKVVPNKKV